MALGVAGLSSGRLGYLDDTSNQNLGDSYRELCDSELIGVNG